jgi:glutathione S-transferase|tara:strand:+ start:241 stop:417 length:177 start_codon:yes stop_codon:yes gene_type:complete
MFKGENKSPEILKLNPDGKVPFVIINNDIYKESASILRLVASIVGPLTSYYPSDPFIR